MASSDPASSLFPNRGHRYHVLVPRVTSLARREEQGRQGTRLLGQSPSTGPS
jgi:hypothetical protein